MHYGIFGRASNPQKENHRNIEVLGNYPPSSAPQFLAADLIEPTTRDAVVKPLVQKLRCQELIERLVSED